MTAEQRWIQPRALGLPMRSATVSARPWGRSSTTGVTTSSGVASTLGSARSKVGPVVGADVRAFRTSPLFGGRAGRQAVAGRDDGTEPTLGDPCAPARQHGTPAGVGPGSTPRTRCTYWGFAGRDGPAYRALSTRFGVLPRH